MNRWYFDHAAATPVLKEVIKEMEPYLSIDFANPSALHKEGRDARKCIENARERIAKSLGVSKNTCIFTSCATESIFLAIVGSVKKWKENHKEEIPEVIVSSIEHDAVLESARYLEKEGVVVHYVPVDEFGFVDIDFIKSHITKNTVIISIGLVNNEIGTIQKFNEIAKAVRYWKKDVKGVTRDKHNEGDDIYPLLHTDGTQAICYYGLNILKLGADLFSCNSSKIYGPKGVGLLYKTSQVDINPITIKGSQEFGMRAGTEPVALIAGFAEAFVQAQLQAVSETFRLLSLQELLFDEIKLLANKNNIKVTINGPLGDNRVVNNVNVSFHGVNHEYLVLLLDNEGFAVSTKSACNEREAEESHVLYALSLSNKENENRPLSGLRITLGNDTTKEAILALAKALDKTIKLSLTI